MFNKIFLTLIAAVVLTVTTSHAQMIFDNTGLGRYYAVQKSETQYEIFGWAGTNKDKLLTTVYYIDNVMTFYDLNGTKLYTENPTTNGGTYYDANGNKVAYFTFNKMNGIDLYINDTLSYYTIPGANNGISVFYASNKPFFNVIQCPPSLGANTGTYILFSLVVMKIISL